MGERSQSKMTESACDAATTSAKFLHLPGTDQRSGIGSLAGLQHAAPEPSAPALTASCTSSSMRLVGQTERIERPFRSGPLCVKPASTTRSGCVF